ncbi:MAG TPA: hypothetical protein V6C69_09535 [Trichormus sp.]
MINKKAITYLCFVIALSLTFCTGQVRCSVADVSPDTGIKTPLLVTEESVSTFIPSLTAPGQGLAVNIIYPPKPRYKDGAPIAVIVPAGDEADGLHFSAHTIQCGFCEVRFAFPGGGVTGLHSSGIYDYRGDQSQQGLRDVILFAAGKIADTHGRHIGDLVPVPVNINNVGVVGWSNGGNAAIITMAKFSEKLAPAIKWLAFYESSVGAMLYPPNLGCNRDLVINGHYRQGSCATGDCLVDYRHLFFQSDGYRYADAHKKRGEPVIPGILCFDENKSKKWDEASEFAFNYALDVGLNKQIYPPDVTAAMGRKGLFLDWKEDTGPGGFKTDAKGKILNPDSDELSIRELKAKGKARKDKHEAWVAEVEAQLKAHPNPNIKVLDHETVNVRFLNWPDRVATLDESEAYFKDRDGSLFIEGLCEKYPALLVTVFGSQIDHLQRQPDHPNIALLYNAFLADKCDWVRLNPDPLYVGQAATMNIRNFVNNKPNAPVDASAIVEQLEPEGLVPDFLYMDATVSELADRVQKKKETVTLDAVLVDYKYGAGPMPKQEQEN